MGSASHIDSQVIGYQAAIRLRKVSFGRGDKGRSGFTLIEVALAATVLAFGLTMSIICIQIGLRDLDVARTSTAVSQVLQNEMERLRLEDWDGIAAMPPSGPLDLDATFLANSAMKGKIEFTRTVADVTGFADMKEIVLTANWRSIDGQVHSRSYRMRYGKGGLFDYYYKSNVDL